MGPADHTEFLGPQICTLTTGQRTIWCRNIAENFSRLSRAHERYRQTDRRQTDGRPTTYSEHELEFTFGKNQRGYKNRSRFLANVNSSSRSLYVVVRPSVCRLSETFVRPTQTIEIFGNVSTPPGTLAIHDLSVKILRRSSQGNPSVGGVKHKRGSRI